MSENVYHTGGGTTEEEMKAKLEANLQTKMQQLQAQAEAKPEIAELVGWWNLWARGPYQWPSMQPGKVIKAGQWACVQTVLWLNPNFPNTGVGSALSILSTLACSFEIRYCTGNLCTWTPGPRALNVVREQRMVANQGWYYDTLCFRPEESWEGCYEMNICAHIKGCNPDVATPFAGFVTWVQDFDYDQLYPAGGPPGAGPHWQFERPIRFMIYP